MDEVKELENKISEVKLKMENAGNNTAEIYQKITGYARPVSQWNLGKKVEYSDRREYNM